MGGSSKEMSGRRPWRRRVLFLVYSVVAALLLMELGIRFLSEEQGDDVVVMGLRLVPLSVVPESHRLILRTDSADLPYVVPDRELGWTIRPHGKTGDGLFQSNARGLRCAPAPIDPAPAGVKRILLVGDSFTHGDEVPWADTWAARLQDVLGSEHQVLNGGVGGYGTDQALLRARRLQPKIKPDVVVLGIYIQDLLRNLTVFRSVKHPWTHYPWSKPRFVLDEKLPSGLKLVNFPVQAWPPEQVITTLENYDDHSELRQHDRLWFSPFYEDSFAYRSRLYRWRASKRIQRDRYESRRRLMRADGEGVLVAARIARLFRQETSDANATPVVVLLPGKDEVAGYAKGKKPPLRHLHQELQRLDVPFIDVGSALLGALAPGEEPTALYLVSHPNRRANQVIADTLAPHVR